MIVGASFDTNNPEMWFNRALQYGDGVFETMRVNQAHIPLLKWHLERLQSSLTRIKLEPFEEQFIAKALLNLPATMSNSCVLKLVVFRAQQKRTYQPLTNQIEWVLMADELAASAPAELISLGVADTKLSHQKSLAGLKHLSRLEQVLLAGELHQAEGVDDLILIDGKNRIVETTYQNLIFIKGQQLFTPKLNRCGVFGVALRWLNTVLEIKSIHVKIKQINSYDGILVVNSIRGIRAVDKVFYKKGKEAISFATSNSLQDKINQLWLDLFSS